MAISRFQLELASLRELPPNEVDGFADSSPIVLAYLGRQDYLCVYQNLSRVYIFLDIYSKSLLHHVEFYFLKPIGSSDFVGMISFSLVMGGMSVVLVLCRCIRRHQIFCFSMKSSRSHRC